MAHEIDALRSRLTLVKAPKPQGETHSSVAGTVAEILSAVRAEGDSAVRRYSEAFDKVAPETVEVSMAEREAAVARLDRRPAPTPSSPSPTCAPSQRPS